MEVSLLKQLANTGHTPGRHWKVPKRILLAWLLAGCLPVLAQAPSERMPEETRVLASSPQTPEPDVAGLKAASLLNFLGYAEWPASAFAQPGAPWRVGILGDDVLLLALQQAVQGREVAGRAVDVLRLGSGSAQAELESLHLLFVASGQGQRLPRLASKLATQSILLVSESKGALEQGSVINLGDTRGKISFDVSLAAAQRRGITLSSRMLTLADSVKTAQP